MLFCHINEPKSRYNRVHSYEPGDLFFIMPRATKVRPALSSVNLVSSSDSSPPWAIGRPQPVIEALANQEMIVGDVLDVGCGGGENALLLASRGHMVWGIDCDRGLIQKARQEAQEREIDATFVVGNALELDVLGEGFHTVIDSGLFHSLSDKERKKYLSGLSHVMFPGSRLYLLCLSEQDETPTADLYPLSRKELEKYFQSGWQIEKIEPSLYALCAQNAPAWLVSVLKL